MRHETPDPLFDGSMLKTVVLVILIFLVLFGCKVQMSFKSSPSARYTYMTLDLSTP